MGKIQRRKGCQSRNTSLNGAAGEGNAIKNIKLYDSNAMARFLDITERRVRQLRDEGVISTYGGNKNLYERDTSTVAYINFLRKRNPESGESIDYNAERAKLIRAKRLNEEYDLKVKERELHSTEDITAAFSKLFAELKNSLLALPTILAPLLAKKMSKSEITAIITRYIKEELQKLSESGEKIFADITTEPDAQSDKNKTGGEDDEQ